MSFFREHIVKRATRSSGWGKLRKAFVKAFPECAVCGRDRTLEVHHKKDFSNNKELELEWYNLITLCKRCHLLIGHLNYWKSINPTVQDDCIWLNHKIKNRRT